MRRISRDASPLAARRRMRLVPVYQGTQAEQQQVYRGIDPAGAASVQAGARRVRAAGTVLELQRCAVSIAKASGFSLFGAGVALQSATRSRCIHVRWRSRVDRALVLGFPFRLSGP